MAYSNKQWLSYMLRTVVNRTIGIIAMVGWYPIGALLGLGMMIGAIGTVLGLITGSDDLFDGALEMVLFSGGIFVLVWWFAPIVIGYVSGKLEQWELAPLREGMGGDTHGSADWARERQIEAAGLFCPTGVRFGVMSYATCNNPSIHDHRFRWLRHDAPGHYLIFAPTRSGKGTTIIVPTLLDAGSQHMSVFVVDPKGENYSITARRRSEQGSDLVLYDPFGVTGHASSAYNPLDFVHDIDDANVLASSLIYHEEPPREAYFSNKATEILAGMILMTAKFAPPEARNLGEIRRMITAPPDDLRGIVETMLGCGGAIAAAAGGLAQLMGGTGGTLASVLSEAQTHTAFLDSDAVMSTLNRTTFDLAKMKNGDRPVAVYLVIPPNKLKAYSRWLRLMIIASSQVMQKTAGQKRETLFLLDEFGNLGRLDPVLQDITLAAGYGAKYMLILQDVARLESLYGKAYLTFLSNAAVTVFFAVSDQKTCDYVSRALGKRTIQVESMSLQGQGNITESQTGRDLMTPDEVRTMDHSYGIMFARGVRPILYERVNYFEDPSFEGLYSASNMR